MKVTRRPIILALLIAAAAGGCASNGKQSASTEQAAEARIVGDIPTDSPFAKIRLGMSQRQVYDLIGDPTDTIEYMTGKVFIPFYFGNDAVRTEALYKNQGRITFTGASAFGGRSFKVYRIVYDPNEDGYNNR